MNAGRKCDWCGVTHPFNDMHDITTAGDWWTVCGTCRAKVRTDAELINDENAKQENRRTEKAA